MNNKKIRQILLIGIVLFIFLIIGFFVLPIKDGRSIYKTILHNRSFSAAIQPNNYDKMRITYGNVKTRITGTEKFDTPDGKSVDDGSLLSNMEGIDVSAFDNYVRTFDIVTYTLELRIERNELTTTPDDTFKGGIIKVKATIPESQDGLKYMGFLTDSWMKNARRSTDYQEITTYYQIPDDKSPVGGIQELSFTVITSGYKGDLSEEYTPKFEVWMEGNKNDDPSSTIDSVTISDHNNLKITGTPRQNIQLIEGGINHKTVLDGVKGNYISFAVKGSPSSGTNNAKGSLITLSPINSKMKIEYYYKNTDLNTSWIKIEEGDPKATDIINGTRLISYGVACTPTPGFWPDENSNKGYSSSCGVGSLSHGGISTYGGNLSLNSQFDSGILTASQNNNIISFTNTDTVFNSFYHGATEFVDGFELFVPYYDDGGGNYEYQIKIIDYELSFKDSSNEEYTINPNASLTYKIQNQLNGNVYYFLRANGNNNNNTNDYVTISSGSSNKFEAYSYAKDGNYDGGKDTLITIDTSAVSLEKYSDTKELYYSYQNNGSFPTPAIDTVIVKYGIYKLNPTVGLNTDELVNDAVYEDFDWYSTLAEAKEHGEPCAIYILEPENKGNSLRLNTVFNLKGKSTSEAINHIGMVKHKIRYFEDVEKTKIHSVGYNNSYYKVIIGEGNSVTAGTPSGLGHTYIISSYNLNTKTLFTKNQSNTINANVLDDTLDVQITPYLEYEGEYPDTIKSNFKLETILPNELAYKENSANVNPDEVIETSSGTKLIWYFNNQQINSDFPVITFSTIMSRYSVNNSQKRINTVLYDIDNPILEKGESYATASIINLAGSSLKKKLNYEIIEKNSDVEIRDYIYNISQAILLNVKTFEILPKNNDEYGSKFSGTYTYTINSIAEGQHIYYTTAGINTINFDTDDLGNKTIESINLENDSRFIEVQIGDTIPSNATMLATYIDEVDTMEDKSFSYTMHTNGNKNGDKYNFIMNASSSTLENSIHTEKIKIGVIDRKISGIAFEDINRNNVYDENTDILLKNIEVNLLDNLSNKIETTETNNDGYYEFNNLEKGNYYIQFKNKQGYEIINKDTTNFSNKANLNGITDVIDHNIEATNQNVLIEHINFGIRKKDATLTVHHYIKDTTTTLKNDEISTVYYTDEYQTNRMNPIPTNYQFHSVVGTENGIVDSDNIVVTYYYSNKTSIVTAKYIDESGNDIINPIEKIINWGEGYTTDQKDFDYYDFVEQTGDLPNGPVDKDEINVIYKYKLKTGKVITHHYLYDGNPTTTPLAADEIKTYKYTKEYTTSVSNNVSPNYEFYSKTNNYRGTVTSSTTEVIYYYQLKNSNITSTIEKTATELITSKDEEVDYHIKYKATVIDYIGDATITLIEHLPYEIEETKSTLLGGVYNAEEKTITWQISWPNINTYNETDLKSVKEITKDITVVYKNIPATDRMMVSTTTGKIEITNNQREVEAQADTNIRIKGKVVIKYIDIETGELIEAEVTEEDLIGESVPFHSIEKEGWILVEVPPEDEYEFTEEEQIIIYKYERLKYDIHTEVIGTGGTIVGNEIVYYGEDSTKDYIVIIANPGYVIDKIIVDGKEQVFLNSTERYVLENFKGVKKNHDVKVLFRTKIENPITNTNKRLIIISIVFITILSVISKKHLKKY